MPIKIRFRCMACPALLDLEGENFQYREYLGALRAEGWRVLIDHMDVSIFCPNCPLPEF